jgi:hypothetical protein
LGDAFVESFNDGAYGRTTIDRIDRIFVVFTKFIIDPVIIGTVSQIPGNIVGALRDESTGKGIIGERTGEDGEDRVRRGSGWLAPAYIFCRTSEVLKYLINFQASSGFLLVAGTASAQYEAQA